MRLSVAAVLAVSFSLAACGEEAVERGDDDARTAVGEVRGGTISDAMLPLDTVQSQSPPLREATQPQSQDDDTDDAPEGNETPEAESVEAPESTEPTPEG